MPWQDFFLPLLGGALIGLASSLLLLLKGRVFGISGILSGVLVPHRGETAWRVAVLLGLVSAGAVLAVLYPPVFALEVSPSLSRYIAAGLLVGFGTTLGGGCTSGHGVCGISRLSPRSIVATLTFMGAGILTVWLVRLMGGLS